MKKNILYAIVMLIGCYGLCAVFQIHSGEQSMRQDMARAIGQRATQAKEAVQRKIGDVVGFARSLAIRKSPLAPVINLGFGVSVQVINGVPLLDVAKRYNAKNTIIVVDDAYAAYIKQIKRLGDLAYINLFPPHNVRLFRMLDEMTENIEGYAIRYKDHSTDDKKMYEQLFATENKNLIIVTTLWFQNGRLNREEAVQALQKVVLPKSGALRADKVIRIVLVTPTMADYDALYAALIKQFPNATVSVAGTAAHTAGFVARPIRAADLAAGEAIGRAYDWAAERGRNTKDYFGQAYTRTGSTIKEYLLPSPAKRSTACSVPASPSVAPGQGSTTGPRPNITQEVQQPFKFELPKTTGELRSRELL